MPEVLLLAKRLNLLRTRLDEAWEDATKKQREKLQPQFDELDRQVMMLISVAIKDSGKEYDIAVEALGKANTALRTALDSEEKFIKAINAIADALDLVGKVVALA